MRSQTHHKSLFIHLKDIFSLKLIVLDHMAQSAKVMFDGKRGTCIDLLFVNVCSKLWHKLWATVEKSCDPVLPYFRTTKKLCSCFYIVNFRCKTLTL